MEIYQINFSKLGTSQKLISKTIITSKRVQCFLKQKDNTQVRKCSEFPATNESVG